MKPKKEKTAKGETEIAAGAQQAAREETVAIDAAKSVETMFRNAFRTEMELLALAATKPTS